LAQAPTDLDPLSLHDALPILPRAVAEAGRAALTAKIERHRPGVVCFNGRATYERYSGRAPLGWGLQRETIGASRVFVVPSTSGRDRKSTRLNSSHVASSYAVF